MTSFRRAARELELIREHIGEGQSFEELDPNAYEAVGTILGIMRGEITGRNIQTRLQAAVRILEEYRGKPVQKTEADIGHNLLGLLEKSMEREHALRSSPSAGALPSPPEKEPIDAEVLESEEGALADRDLVGVDHVRNSDDPDHAGGVRGDERLRDD